MQRPDDMTNAPPLPAEPPKWYPDGPQERCLVVLASYYDDLRAIAITLRAQLDRLEAYLKLNMRCDYPEHTDAVIQLAEAQRENERLKAQIKDCEESAQDERAFHAKQSLERLNRAEAATARADANEKDAATRLRLIQLHHADAMELWKALNDLSFECDDVFSTKAPSRQTYNRTFEIQEKHRQAYSEAARKNAEASQSTAALAKS